jgi:glucosamine 6-phosphate synthetase-like amidotransferase/phosphosugar isomerase protein
VHNGIVENYLQLKNALIAKGHKFLSETDTEIIAHVIQDELELAASATSAAVTPPAKPASKYGGFEINIFSSSTTESQSVASETAGTTTEANSAEAVVSTPYSLLLTPYSLLLRPRLRNIRP